MRLKPHPVRQRIVQEMHLRPGLPLDGPGLAWQLLYLLDKDDATQATIARDHTRQIVPDLADNARHASLVADDYAMAWELHSEACSVTLAAPRDASDRIPTDLFDWMRGFPGIVLRAVKIIVAADRDEASAICRTEGVEGRDVVAGVTSGYVFRSTFQYAPRDGFGRLVVHPTAAADWCDLGRVVQQLQELGNYRNLALLGHDLVRRHNDTLANFESAIGGISKRLDRDEALGELTRLAQQVARLREFTAYRLGASRAYGGIVQDRLDALDPNAVKGAQRLADFTERRLSPALRTVASFARRLDALALRIEQASALLRVRIETRLAEQNKEILTSISATANRQLRLQHLVEGLSVFAVAYYAMGLMSYLLGTTKSPILAWLVIPTILILLGLLRWQRARIEKASPVDIEWNKGLRTDHG